MPHFLASMLFMWDFNPRKSLFYWRIRCFAIASKIKSQTHPYFITSPCKTTKLCFYVSITLECPYPSMVKHLVDSSFHISHPNLQTLNPNSIKSKFMNLFILLMCLLTFYSILDDHDDKP